MKELTDENFRELYRPVVKGAGFITDASRRRVVDMIKKQNFLAFNPLQLNVFYLAALAIIVLSIGAAFISNNVGNDTGNTQNEVNFHTLKHEDPVAKPAEKKPEPPKKTESVAPVDTSKTNSVKPIAEKPTEPKAVTPEQKTETPAQNAVPFAGVAEAKKILGTIKFSLSSEIPVIFVKPDFSKPEKALLPKMPDSLPPQKKIVPRVRPQVAAPVIVDSAKPAPRVKPDTSVAKAPANTAPAIVPAEATVPTVKQESQPETSPESVPVTPTTEPKK